MYHHGFQVTRHLTKLEVTPPAEGTGGQQPWEQDPASVGGRTEEV